MYLQLNANSRSLHLKTNLDFEGKRVAALVAPADALDTRGHVERVFPHVRPVAHHPRLPDDAPVLVAPGFVKRPPGRQTRQGTSDRNTKKLKQQRRRPVFGGLH